MTTRSHRRSRAFAALCATLALLAAGAAVVVTGASGSSGAVASGSGELTWEVTGRATATIATPSPAECGGAACVVLADAEAPAGPAGACTPTAAEHFEVRCPTAGVQRLRVTGTGNLPVEVTMAGAECPPLEVTISQTASNGPVHARDGCRQAIECTAHYAGRVEADGRDQIGAGCRSVTVDGVDARVPGDEPPCTTPGRGCAPGTGGGGSSTGGTSPVAPPKPGTVPDGAIPPGQTADGKPIVASVGLRRTGGSFRTTVSLRQKARYAVVLRRRDAKGRWARVAGASRSGRVGANRVVFRSTATRRLRAGLYRAVVTVASPGAKPVRSPRVRKR